ncbi:histidine kinase N-terminal 7TM domain-containing protein [Salinirubellus sp. GCM10025818]|uniref:histidine kinase N-terminal 7TM domain-containing protein n=1 Tax=Salinirubellus TaxID=2162630 RepID=UPI0030CF3668
MSTIAATVIGLRLLACVITGSLAVYAWNRRTEPGSLPFVGLMAMISLWTLNSAISAFVFDSALHILLHRIRWIPIMIMPVFWIWFAVAYTGYDEYLSPATIALVCAIPLISIGLLLTNPMHQLLWEISIGELHGLPILELTYGPWFGVFTLYNLTITFIGTALLLRLVVRSDYLYLDQAILLCIGSLIPWIAAIISIMGVIFPPGIGITSVSFAATGPAFGYALFRRRLFDLAPATRRLSRDAAIATLQEGVLIFDDSFDLIYLNHRAAEILERDIESTLGTPAEALIDIDTIDLGVSDALSELHIDDRTYEARISTITDRNDRTIGHTIILADITAKKRRERLLQQQRDHLELLDRLNGLVREITHEFVNATSRSEIEEVVRNRMRESTLYTEVRIIDIPPDIAHTEHDTLHQELTGASTALRLTDQNLVNLPEAPLPLPELEANGGESWAFVSLGFGRTVYGGLALQTTRTEAFSERELAVLEWFGETVSQAINAVENRRLLFSNAVTELRIDCPDTPLQTVAADASCSLTLKGFIPASEDRILVYCDTVSVPASDIAETAETIDEIPTSRVVGDDASNVVEFTITEGSPLLAFVGGKGNVRTIHADEQTCTVVVEIASGSETRSTLERVREHCPTASLAAKQDHDRSTSTETNQVPATVDSLESLTDRQLEVLEAAYRGGYFRWPRDATAEEVAESLGISSPTLHKHLRHGEARVFEALFDSDSETDSSNERE